MKIANLVLQAAAAEIVSALLTMLNPSSAVAATYSCGTPDANHCYGQVEWIDRTEIFGVSTTLSPVNLYCNSCDGFVDDEMWLADINTPKCQTNKFEACWVEVGFERLQGRKNTDFFWADVRPGHGFSEHWLGAINGVTDDLQLLVVKDTSQSATSTTFLVVVADASLNAVVLHSGKSTKNTMVATSQTIGQELYGSHGSAADPEIFQHIQASHSANQLAVAGALIDRSNGGSVTDDSPPLGAWLVTPATLPSGAIQPGAFVTACCDQASPTPFSATIPVRRTMELRQIRPLLSQYHPSTGIEALQAPSREERLARVQVEQFLASQTSLGRVTPHGARAWRGWSSSPPAPRAISSMASTSA